MDLYRTDLTQETCATLDEADYVAPTRQHELRTSYRSSHGYSLKYLDHQVVMICMICLRCGMLLMSERRWRSCYYNTLSDDIHHNIVFVLYLYPTTNLPTHPPTHHLPLLVNRWPQKRHVTGHIIIHAVHCHIVRCQVKRRYDMKNGSVVEVKTQLNNYLKNANVKLQYE